MNCFIKIVLLTVLACVSISAFSQTDSLQARADLQTWADVRKAYFKTTKDDSLFVVNNSDAPFEYSTYVRPELDGVMESMFFNAQPGDVIGPLFLEDYAAIFKVASYDTTYRIRASHIYVKPEGNKRKDTLRAEKTALQYLADIEKGADFTEMAKKHGKDETAPYGGDLGWLWEGGMTKEFEVAAMKAKKGDVFTVRTPAGYHVVKITEDKVRDRGKVVLIPLVKKLAANNN